ncbi:MAG: DEAD/DEAH box helicase [Bacteroidales bacterium]|nr:DEAD/DEAH box helicase [Bacteroidales bacterium]
MTFADLNINTPLRNAIADLGFTTPTIIQERVFPAIMSGQDVVGIAQTGTGKTYAYLLPVLRMWKFTKEIHPQILIVVPTRELVTQVVEEVQKLTTYMSAAVVGVYGGVNIKQQMITVSGGMDVLVATPGRLLDLVLNGSIRLKSVKRLIIDEVDEMLNLGFRPQLIRIIDLLPPKRQNLMFSATITEEVNDLIHDFFNAPLWIEASPMGTPLENIEQICYHLPNFYTKINLLELLLANKEECKKVLIFAATKKLADQIAEEIEPFFPEEIGVIHSNKAQNNRFATVAQFHSGEIRILIATDLVARGLDISEVSHVINFDTPDVPENYIHRIGRTGRADKKGNSITFVTKAEKEAKEAIEELMNTKIPRKNLPEELEISKLLTDDESPKVEMKNILVKLPPRDEAGPSFHEKLEKNKKVNNKIRRCEQMKMKYKKPKTRGMKPIGKKNKK